MPGTRYPHGHHDHGPGAHQHDDHEHAGHVHHGGVRGFLEEILKPHSHDAAGKVDATLESSQRGIRAVKVSLAVLGVAALLQLAVVLISGSVGLLADTIHNFSDALTAIPLWFAFALGRRRPSSRYTYGYGKAEDLAGVAIVALIALSAALAGWESLLRLLHPQPVRDLPWVMAAAVIGFVGNEAVAMFRIGVGRDIGSAALVADGYHARTDGFTSLAVLIGALGVLAGFPLADPIVGLAITAAILVVLASAARGIWHRLMDAVDPQIGGKLMRAARLYGVQDVRNVRARWLGHRLEADLTIVVNADLPTSSGHAIAEAVRHALFHAEPKLSTISVHVDPASSNGADYHAATAHHGLSRTD